MTAEHLVDLPDDAYRAHWLAFHEQLDWSKHQDMTRVPITCAGPDALYRRNKGSFMENLRPEVHCRPYTAHARRAKRSGAWVSDDSLFELPLAPTLDFTPAQRGVQANVARLLRRYFHLPAPLWPELTVTRSPQFRR